MAFLVEQQVQQSFSSRQGFRAILLGSIAVLSILLFSCETVNPYENPDVSGIELTPIGIDTGDSLSIFCTKQIKVDLLVREHLKAYRISAPGNHLWGNPDSLVTSDQFPDHSHSFSVSYADTGRHIIRAEAIRSRGDTVAVEVPIYLYSPMHQKSVECILGDQVQLFTNEVCDEDIAYVWKIGTDTFFSSNPFTIVKPTKEFIGSGALWAQSAAVRSPVHVFDAVITKSSQFTLVVLGSDGSEATTEVQVPENGTKIGARVIGDLSQLERVTVDGRVFQDFTSYTDSIELWTDITPPAGSVRPATISYASRTGSQGSRTIVLRRMEKPPQFDPKLEIRYPSEGDTTRNASLAVLAHISGTEAWDLYSVELVVNGLPLNNTLPTVNRSVWESGLVDVVVGRNTIEARLYRDDSLISSDNVSFTRIIDSALSVKIVQIKGMSVPEDSILVFDDPLLEVGVEASPVSKIQTVLVNEVAAMARNGLHFAEIEGEPDGKEITIIATAKSSGQSVMDSVTVMYNRAPEWGEIEFPAEILAGETVTIHASATDKDDDRVLLYCTVKKEGNDLDSPEFSDNEARWHVPSDSGLYEIVLSADDGYENIDTTIYRYITLPDESRTVSFQADSSVSEESESPSRIAVILSRAGDEPITVDYQRHVAGTTTDGRIVFDPGNTTSEIVYEYPDNFLAGGDETVLFTLQPNPGSHVELGQNGSTHKLIIRDDDFILTIESSVGGMVTLNPAPRGEEKTYKRGTRVTLTAEPDPGYRFSSWSGDPVDEHSGNRAEVTMNTSKTVRAVFTQTTQPVDKPVIASQPKDTTVEVGDTATFVLAAEGESLEFQWYRGEQKIGTSKSSYTTPAAEQANDGDRYHCVVSNEGGVVVSDTAVLTVIPRPIEPPVITSGPRDQTVSVGNQAVFTVEANGDGPLIYSWIHNGNPVTNVSDKTLTTSALEAGNDGDLYQCIVSNEGGADTSRVATVRVLVPVPVDSVWVDDFENVPKGTSLCAHATWSAAGNSANCDKIVVRERDGGNVVTVQANDANALFTKVPKGSNRVRFSWRWRYEDTKANVVVGPIGSPGSTNAPTDAYRVRIESQGSKWKAAGTGDAARGAWPKISVGVWYYMQLDLNFETNLYSLSYATSPDDEVIVLVEGEGMAGVGPCEYIMIETGGGSSTAWIDDMRWETKAD